MPSIPTSPRRAVVALLAALLLCLPAAYAQNGGNFFAGINYSSGSQVNPGNSGIGAGGIFPNQVVAGDFNNDKMLDVVVAGTCPSTLPACTSTAAVVAVYLGNGSGVFQAPILNTAGIPPSLRSIAVGDFNHDGNLDVAAASDDGLGTITILLGDGKGNLKESSQTALNGIVGQANTLAVGDFNGDNKLDLAVGVQCYNASGCPLGGISIFLGDGAGNLSAPVNYQTAATGPSVPVVADFNGDGKLDVATANYFSPTRSNSSSSLTMLLNNGNGTFKAPVVSALGFYPAQQIVAADFNGDNNLDLAILTGWGPVEVMFGQGSGAFDAPVAYDANSAYSLVVSDLNGDGKPDLMAAGASGYSNFAVPLVNNGAGAFAIGAESPLGGRGSASLAAGDFNGDGKQDVLLTSYCSETSSLDSCPDGTLSVLLGSGNGAMQGAVPANLTIAPHHVVLADMNGDGVPDMVGTEDCYEGGCNQLGGVVVALGIGDGRFGPAVAYPVPYVYPSGVAVADLNGDGHLDVVVDGYDNSANSNSVAVLLGSSGGSLGSAATYAVAQEELGPPAIGDFAGNKKLGVAVSQRGSGESTSGVAVLLGNGDGTLQAEAFTQTSEISPYSVIAGDFNKDGKADLAVFGDANATQLAGDGGVTVLLSQGDGTFQVKPDPDANPADNYFRICDSQDACAFLASYPGYGVTTCEGWDGYAPLAAGDLNGDGNLDLVIANECEYAGNPHLLVYFYGNGDGTFNDAENDVPAQELADANYLGVAVADVNGDGKPDIVASTLSGVAVYLAPFTAARTIYATSGITDAEIPAIADINGDGAPDIAISNGGNSVGSAVVDLLFNRFPEPPAPTATALASSADPATLGQAVTFTATVSAASGAAPAGTVTFTHGGVAYPAVSLVDGVATLTTSADLSVGAHTIRAIYSGTSTDAPSESAGLVQTVVYPTTTALASAANPSAPGAAVTLTATVSAASGAVPTGTVTFTHGGVAYPAVALNGGVATYSAAGLGAGSHTIRAVYSGSSTDAASTSAPLTQVVLVATSTALAASPNPSALGQAVTFTATVTAASGSTPTGTVTFTHGGVAYPAVALVNGVASLTTSAGLTVGTHTIRAVYSGSSTDAGSSSGPVSEVVEQ